MSDDRDDDICGSASDGGAAAVDSDGSDGGVLVCPFLWPCHKRAPAYARARADAERAAPRLARALRALRRGGATRVVVVAHSLGCRVALRALRSAEGESSTPPLPLPTVVARGGALPPPPPSAPETASSSSLPPPVPPVAPPSATAAAQCDHLFLLGGAVASDALAPGGEFDRRGVRATHVCVMHSRHDEVLQRYFGLGEALAGGLGAPRAMGLVGLTTPSVPTSSGASSSTPPPPASDGGVASVAPRQAVELISSPRGEAATATATVGDNDDGATPRTTECVDVSRSVPCHNPNLWLLADEVVRPILRAAATGVAAAPRHEPR